jgi:hypothetical protein
MKLRVLAQCAVLAILGAVGLEVGAWVFIGPPMLSVADPTIEYMMRPNQDASRFGNHYHINAYGMRSPELTKKKPGEFRVIVFGDSVVNGGHPTDQSELATTILSQQGFTVGNVSAGSWGPPNILAYIEKYGLFQADVVVLVLSTHDYADAPTFAPLDPLSHPTKMPVSLLLDSIRRYMPGRANDSPVPLPLKADVDASLLSLERILSLAKTQTRVVVFLHPTRTELKEGIGEGRARIVEVCDKVGVEVVKLDNYYRPTLDLIYRDDIHLNATGQRALAGAFAEHIRR